MTTPGTAGVVAAVWGAVKRVGSRTTAPTLRPVSARAVIHASALRASAREFAERTLIPTAIAVVVDDHGCAVRIRK
jgi:hypothetical protein